MKLFGYAAAALVALTGITPVGVVSAADAQQRVVVRERTVVHTRNNYRRPVAKRTVCTNRWRDGRRVRVCRTVRRSYR